QLPWDDAKKKCLMNSPTFIQAFQFFVDLRQKWAVQPTTSEQVAALVGNQNIPPFVSGKIGMGAIGGELIGLQIPFRWGVATLPSTGPGKNMSGRNFARGLHMDAGSRVAEAAWRVHRWMFVPENNIEFVLAAGQPVTALKAAADELLKRWGQET